MTFEELLIRNFGLYQDVEAIDLKPNATKPIILFGGMNGGGKTTLLDAIILCLYGPLAITSNRGSKGYHNYIRSSFNRDTSDSEAFIELTFKHEREGKQDRFTIRRTWVVKSTIQETIFVKVNGEVDLLLQENWLDFIDELIPAKVANLFFFDGEKIEQFADLENARYLLESALHSLLGIDILKQLSLDLVTLSQRKKTALKSDQDQQELAKRQQTLSELKEELTATNKQLAEPRSDLIQAEKNYKKAVNQYRRSGGDLYDQHTDLKDLRASIEADIKKAKVEFIEAASNESPLMLIPDLLDEVHQQAIQEVETAKIKDMLSTLKKRDSDTLKTVEKFAGLVAKNEVEKHLSKDREEYEKISQQDQYLYLSSDGQKQVHKASKKIKTASAVYRQTVKNIANLEEELEQTDKKIQSIPDTETIQRLQKQVDRWDKERQALETKISELEAKAVKTNSDIKSLESVIFNKLESNLDLKFKQADDVRIIEYAAKAKDTLATLTTQVVQQQVVEIEDLILDSISQLLHKSNLINKIQISATDYSLSLFDSKNEQIPPTRLSAGERQLLAIAILWALARASKLQLPIIIDTPLGRLDGEHRTNLLSSYFPRASHQVIILSTDTEIAKSYYDELEPYIAASYQIEHNPLKQTSSIAKGYKFI